MERKKEIVKHLGAALLECRCCRDLVGLKYEEDTERVRVRSVNRPDRYINVAGDSGEALIRDILREV